MSRIMYWIKKKVWVTPAIFGAGAIILAVLVYYMDLWFTDNFQGFIPPILLTEVPFAKDILGILSAALLTMTTFTFSTALVVLTTYSSQFSPRTVENFIYGKVTRWVLGIFLGGFIYTTLSLLFMQSDLADKKVLAASIGVLITFFCVASFAYYVHHVATNIQVDTLINKLTEEAGEVIKNYLVLYEKDYVALKEWNPIGVKETVRSEQPGYVQFISFVELLEYAEKNDVQIELIVKIGDYVYENMPVMYIYKKNEKELELNEFYVVGDERTAEEDLGYAIQKLVEVALRAISPGTNDPNTANDIIIRTGRLLGKMGHLKTADWVMSDSDGKDRLLYKFPAYRQIVYDTFYQLAHYGKEDISVLSAISDSLRIAAEISPEERHDTLWNMQKYVLEVLSDQQLKSLDRAHLQNKVDELAAATGRRSINIKDIYEEEA